MRSSSAFIVLLTVAVASAEVYLDEKFNDGK